MSHNTTNQLLRRLRKLKKAVLEDGKIDWNETELLREAIRPLAAKRGFLFENYERLLVKCREDGRITPDESRELALQLDFLCSVIVNQQLRFWLAVVLVALVLVGSLALTSRIISSTDTNALRNPTIGEMPPSLHFPEKQAY